MLGLDATGTIEFCTIVWGAVMLVLLARASYSRSGSVGLPFALILSYTVSNGGAALYLLNSYDPFVSAYLVGMGFTRETVALGVGASSMAMVAALVGTLLADAWIAKAGRGTSGDRVAPSVLWSGSRVLLMISLAVLVVTVAMNRSGIASPGLQAVLAAARDFLIPAASGLMLYYYIVRGGRRPLLVAAITMIVTPAVLLVTTAILADSVTTALIIVSFYFSLRVPRSNTFVRNLAILVVTIALGFLFSVFYMQARIALRSVVFQGGSVGSAVDSVVTSAENFQVDTVLTSDALVLIDARLDQNIFVGMAIENLRKHPNLFTSGETMGLALLGWVPREFWPNKPKTGGSEFMSRVTGRMFSRGTSMGSGPILEFYVDFGYWGVALGFGLLGFVLRLTDMEAYRALHSGDLPRFAQYMCVGTALVGCLASLLTIVTAVAAAFLVGWALRSLWTPQATLPDTDPEAYNA